MVDIFEQVEDDLRTERYQRWAKKYLPWVIGALAAALAIALAWWAWTAYQDGRAAKGSIAFNAGSEALQEAQQPGTTGEAQLAAIGRAKASFTEASKVGNGAYQSLALHQLGGLAVVDGDLADAVAFFDRAAKASGDPLLADVAKLKAAYLVMDTGTYDEALKRLEPLAKEHKPTRLFGIKLWGRESSPMRFNAMEALANLELQYGKVAEARQRFSILSLGQNVPQGTKDRAQQAIAIIDAGLAPSLKAAAAAPATPAAPAATTAPAVQAPAAPAN